MLYIYLFLAGGLGVLARFMSVRWVNNLLGSNFPYGTFFVNVIGSLLFGFLSWYIVHRLSNVAQADELRIGLLTGLLGGYTTFSAFSMETLQLLQNGQMTKALMYILLSVIVCIVACFVGVLLAKQVV